MDAASLGMRHCTNRKAVRSGGSLAGPVAAFLRLSSVCCLLVGVSACTSGKPGTTHRSYFIYADTAAGFARSVRSNAPRGGRAFGLVEITFHPDYKLSPSGQGCSADVNDVGLELVVVLPKWRQGRPVPHPLKRRWARFERSVRAHEQSHIRIARAYAARMRKSIAAMGSDKGCSELSSRIKKRIARIKTQHLRAHDRFDAGEKRRLKSLL